MMTWQETIRAIDRGHHAVQYHTNEEFLARMIGRFCNEGLGKGENTVLICKSSHKLLFEHSIEFQTGKQISHLKKKHEVMFFDSEEILSQVMIGPKPDRQRFERVIQAFLFKASRMAPVRVYADIVDILWNRLERDAAVLIEEYWNELLRQGSFSLLCGYSLDPFSIEVYDDKFARVCHSHSAVIPPEHTEELSRSVQDRLEKVLNAQLSSMVTTLAMIEDRRELVPPVMKYLLWLSRNMPSTAKKVLS